MGFEGWDNVSPYDYKINDDNSFTILFHNEEIHTSRAFRLKSQAEAKAVQYIKKEIGEVYNNDITLDVQKLSVDISSLFGKRSK